MNRPLGSTYVYPRGDMPWRKWPGQQVDKNAQAQAREVERLRKRIASLELLYAERGRTIDQLLRRLAQVEGENADLRLMDCDPEEIVEGWIGAS